MQRIIINENDLTSNVEIMSSYDVAYVPGFMHVNDSNVDTYFRKPTLFTNQYTFAAKIGGAGRGISAIPPTFTEDQPYPKLSDNTEGFPARAIPDSDKMFSAGDIDLGYRVAHYLLSLGIPVYYEVMNNVNSGDLLSTYNYTKVDKVQTKFTEGVNYYVVQSGKTIADRVFVVNQSASIATPVTVNSATFATAFGDHSGTYVFTAMSDDEETPAIGDWTVSPDPLGTAQAPSSWTTAQMSSVLGFTITPGTITANTEYSITVFYDKVNDEVITETVAPGSTDSVFELAVTTLGDGSVVPISDFPEGDVYTMYQEDTCPISVESMYAGLKHRFMEAPAVDDVSFDSVADYSVKYITSGGYPTFEYSIIEGEAASDKTVSMPLMVAMMAMAAKRGDAIALIDHTNNPNRDLFPATLGGSGNSVIDIVRTQCATMQDLDYAAMFTPWYSCSHPSIAMSGALSSFVPGSVGYLSALAIQIRDYNPWLAVSGVVRGKVPNLNADSANSLHTVSKLTNNIADSYQTIPTDTGITQLSINPITYIRNIGYCIWGNRTLRNNGTGTSALSFLNIRGVVSDIKKVIHAACQNSLFEQNTDITWLNFKSVITPVLDRMVSNYILQDYAITRFMTDPETGEPVPAYKVLAVIRIQPINSIEVFELSVQLENTEVIVAEM